VSINYQGDKLKPNQVALLISEQEPNPDRQQNSNQNCKEKG
jgi:hypothetical protein